jgi:hypothetical protein
MLSTSEAGNSNKSFSKAYKNKWKNILHYYKNNKGNKSVFGNIDLLFRVLDLKIDFGTNKY